MLTRKWAFFSGQTHRRGFTPHRRGVVVRLDPILAGRGTSCASSAFRWRSTARGARDTPTVARDSRRSRTACHSRGRSRRMQTRRPKARSRVDSRKRGRCGYSWRPWRGPGLGVPVVQVGRVLVVKRARLEEGPRSPIRIEGTECVRLGIVHADDSLAVDLGGQASSLGIDEETR